MKKYLLLASAAVFVFTVNAQDKSQAVYRDATGKARIDQESNNAPIKQDEIPNEKAASVVDIGTSYNVFTVLGDRQNQVVYNPEINTVGFVHRQNDGGAGGSGVMSFDYSTDGGATWTVNPFQLTPNLVGNGNRYPNITLYNPAANTDPNNAYVVVTGPQLTTGVSSGANGWGGTFRSSSLFAGTNLDEQYTNLSTDVNGDVNEWGAAGLYTAANGVVFDVSTSIDRAGNTNLVADNYSKYFINKGVYNAVNMNFDWTSTTVTPGWNTTQNFTAGMPTNIGGLANMAWSPDGMTGYMVAMGSVGANTMYRPYVMKSTDGGTTWNNVMDYDFSQNSVLQSYIWPLNTNPAVQRPFFSSYDMVVDNNDELRIFCEVSSGYSDHADSLNYTFAARQSGFLFEVATNGANWDVTFIDSIYVDDYEWDATNGLSHFVRPQAARSQDGSKTFYTWIGSDVMLSAEREFPDVWGIGYDIAGVMGNNGWSNIKNLSLGNNSNYLSAYQTVAVDAIENGLDETWELAIVYGTDIVGTSLANGLTAPQWHFLRGVGFSAGDWSTGINENILSDNDVTLYPNPTNGIIQIYINDAKEFNYNIIDVVGNLVATSHVNGSKTSIDLTNNSKGVYFVTINSENGAVTKKLMLTK